MSTTPPIVHVVNSGGALCGFGRGCVPGQWPPGHTWIRIAESTRHDEATCISCRDALALRSQAHLPPEGDERAAALIEQADRGEGRHDVKLVADYLRGRGASAAVIAMRGLFANEGPALLRALFGWRAQGKLERWRTAPSRALAILTDRLVIEYPDTTRALRDAGERDAANAAEAACGKVTETDLPKVWRPGDSDPAPPVPPYARTAALLRQLRERWTPTEPVSELLREVLDAFEAEDLEQ